MIRMKIGELFFDRKAVSSRVDKATRKVLSKFGAYVRRSARQSIRKRKRSSDPGKAPSSHTGLLKRFIFFGYDPAKQSVVIGPERMGKAEAPPALEYGGQSHVVEYQREPGSKSRKTKKTRKLVKIEARPFMGPAFEKEQGQLPQLWRDSVK